MSANDPSFAHPPLVEVVLGLQFSPMEGISSAQLGQFAATLESDFPHSTDAALLDPQFELTGEPFGAAAQLVQSRWKPPGTRLQLRSSNGERLLQIQNGRLVLNWRKVEGPYPSYRELQPIFSEYLERFRSFISSRSQSPFHPEQWEVVYLNHIPAGPLWSSVAGWAPVLPGLLASTSPLANCEIESCAGLWHYKLPQGQGRLHIELSHAAVLNTPESKPCPVMVLQLTARGSAQNLGTEDSLEARLQVGHDSIVRAFASITSPSAHLEWGIGR
jgi:uncharacterized protein (TIGR04255 family)